ncbi:uncharacterized protein N7515_006623 [Penicillium bovifimosum]|uniref:Uncharacterized protein n=1 Tax=Penicillium bovifimosum TaxID=126998 RepID=A0A9W9GWL3_9EURO|nr:uncharacterized protein N7515_006623 [Penicillium bovifimosum]KAJ5130584.1 hypothetical protein N7515_006623 [Penicillium bovifimosum]
MDQWRGKSEHEYGKDPWKLDMDNDGGYEIRESIPRKFKPVFFNLRSLQFSENLSSDYQNMEDSDAITRWKLTSWRSPKRSQMNGHEPG